MAFFGAARAKAETTYLDLLVVYTSELENDYGADGMEANVLASLVSANEGFANSDTGVRLRLAAVKKVDYVESSDMGTDLDVLTDHDGVMDEVFDWRDEYGADLVCLFQNRFTGSTSGIAWILKDTGGKDSVAFSVLYADFALSGLVLQHEIGHNLGAAHDRDNSTSGGLYSYSYGYRFEGSDWQTYRTIMAYSPGQQINYFSDPTTQYAGKPVGMASSHAAAADNARTFRNIAAKVAAYRAFKPQPPFARAGEDIFAEDEDGDGKETVSFDGSGSYAQSGISNAKWTWSGGSASGLTPSVSLGVGLYDVTLEVVDSRGARSTDTIQVEVSSYIPVIDIVAGSNNTFLLKENGRVLAKGNNGYGQLGIGSGEYSMPSFQFVPLTGVSKVATSAENTLFLRENGDVYGAGSNDRGEFGLGDSRTYNRPVKVPIENARDIALWSNGALFVKYDGSVWATGMRGAAGYGAEATGDRLSPEKIVETGAVSVCSGWDLSAILFENGEVDVLGQYDGIVIGDLATSTPERVFHSEVVKIAAGRNHLLFLKSDGSVWGLGSSGDYQLGNTWDPARTPRPLIKSGALAISALARGSAAKLEDGTWWATGDEFRSLDDWRHAALPLKLNAGIEKVSGSGHILFLRSNGSVWGFGSNGDKQIDNSEEYYKQLFALVVRGNINASNPAPVADAGEDLVLYDTLQTGSVSVTLDAGASRDDWLIKSYQWTWPGGSSDQMILTQSFPTGTDTSVSLKVTDDEGKSSTDTMVVKVAQSQGMQSVAAAKGGLFAISPSGQLMGWGQVDGWRYVFPSGVRDVVSDEGGALVIKKDGSLWAHTGLLLGSGSSFVKVADGEVSRASIATYHYAYIHGDGTVSGFGSSPNGQLGATPSQSSKIELLASGAKDVVCLYGFTVVLGVDGSLRALGDGLGNARGEWAELVTDGVSDIWRAGRESIVFKRDDGRVFGVWLHSINVPYGSEFRPIGGGVSGYVAPLPELDDFAMVAGLGDAMYALDGQGSVIGFGLSRYEAGVRQFDWTRMVGGDVTRIAANDYGLFCVMNDSSVWKTSGNGGGRFELTLAPVGPSRSNVAPVAVAGNDIETEAFEGRQAARVTLDGSRSTDDRFVDKWSWAWSGGSAEGRLADALFPIGVTEVALTVTDQEGLGNTDVISVKVFPAKPVESVWGGDGGVFVRSSSGALFQLDDSYYDYFRRDVYLEDTYAELISANAASVASRYNVGLIVNADGALYGYGENRFGQLGIGSGISGFRRRLLIESGVVAAAVSASHSLALMSDGSVLGAGRNLDGELGSDLPGLVFEFEPVVEQGVVSIAAGSGFTLFALSDGTVWSLGRDLSVDPLTTIIPSATDSGLRQLDVPAASEVYASDDTYFILGKDGSLWAGGNNQHGQVGLPFVGGYAAAPQRLFATGVSTVRQLPYRTFVLFEDGALRVFGLSNSGRDFGQSGEQALKHPHTLFSQGVRSVAASNNFSVVERRDGALFVAGDNFGSLGSAFSQSTSSHPWTILRAGDGSWKDVLARANAGRNRVRFTDGGGAYVNLSSIPSTDEWTTLNVSWRGSEIGGAKTYSAERDSYLWLDLGNYRFEQTVTGDDGAGTSDVANFVVASSSAFSAWLKSFYSDEEIALMGDQYEADPDHDGWSNQAEWLLGFDPTAPNADIEVSFRAGANGPAFSLTPFHPAINIDLLGSGDLKNWSPMEDDLLFLDDGSASIPMDASQFFLRYLLPRQ